MFETLTYEDIMDRMLDRIDDSYDKRESSPIYMALAPAALELINIYAAFDDMMDESYADTASREYLERLAIGRGIVPYTATRAIVKCECRPDTIEIEAGTRFSSPESNYTVMEKLSECTYKMECEDDGEIGNTYIGEVVPVDYIENLESAQITEILIYGEEEENTEALRKRYLDSFKANEFGGNRMEYKNRTLAISGVGAVKPIRTWNGAGSVKLVILSSTFLKASDELIQKVQTIFDPEKNGMGDGIAPIGHCVTVDTVEEITVNIICKITYDTGYDWNNCKSAIDDAVNKYLSKLRKDWENQDITNVRISSINAAIMSVPGVLDVQATHLNSTAGNLELNTYQIPLYGGVTDNG